MEYFFICVFDFKAKAYWINTSGNDIIYTLIDNATDEVYQNLTSIANGEKVTARLNPAISMREMNSKPNTIYSVMAVAGYLNAVPVGNEDDEDYDEDEYDTYSISIPNKEVRRTFSNMMAERLFNRGYNVFNAMLKALEKGDVQGIESSLRELLYNSVPSIVLKDEGDYQLIVATAAMNTKGRYEIYMEREAENGRSDMIMKHKIPGIPDIVIEFKKSKSKSDDEETQLKEAEEAIKQIKDREYSYGLGKNPILYGICFNGKKPKVLMERSSV